MSEPPRFVVDDPLPNSHRSTAFFVVMGLAAFLSGGWLLNRGASTSSDVYKKARILDSVIGLISEYYVDSLDGGRLYDLATDGMLRSLADPYTEFLDPDDLAGLRATARGDYIGIGVRVEVGRGGIMVVTPLAETPAEEAGIQPGDRIVAVQGRSTLTWSSDKAVAVLRGDSGTTVELGIVRPGTAQLLNFSLTRTRIHVKSVLHTQLLDGDIAYVQLETVSEQSADEVAEAADRLIAAGATSLVLDLRFNPGGLLSEAVAVSDLFLDAGDVVLETRGRVGARSRIYDAQLPQRWAEMPLVVLVNEFSASAAEVIAGALQDHDRALVLGTSTFGKGLVQTVFPINRTEGLRLTTSRWYTPSGRSIHRDRRGTRQFRSTVTDSGDVQDAAGGIKPDVIVAGETVSRLERRFQRALGSNLRTFRDILGGYAAELAADDSVGDPAAVVVTESMRRELRRRLQERQVLVPRELWNDVRDTVNRQLRRRVLRYRFGREAEMQDQTNNDEVVRVAIELLQRSQTQEELFAVSRER